MTISNGFTEEAKSDAREKRRLDDAGQRAARYAGQRRVNLIWESTQSVIAVSVIGTTLIVAATSNGEVGIVLSNLAALVIGFYFGRTNHERMGGGGSAEEHR